MEDKINLTEKEMLMFFVGSGAGIMATIIFETPSTKLAVGIGGIIIFIFFLAIRLIKDVKEIKRDKRFRKLGRKTEELERKVERLKEDVEELRRELNIE